MNTTTIDINNNASDIVEEETGSLPAVLIQSLVLDHNHTSLPLAATSRVSPSLRDIQNNEIDLKCTSTSTITSTSTSTLTSMHASYTAASKMGISIANTNTITISGSTSASASASTTSGERSNATSQSLNTQATNTITNTTSDENHSRPLHVSTSSHSHDRGSSSQLHHHCGEQNKPLHAAQECDLMGLPYPVSDRERGDVSERAVKLPPPPQSCETSHAASSSHRRKWPKVNSKQPPERQDSHSSQDADATTATTHAHARLARNEMEHESKESSSSDHSDSGYAGSASSNSGFASSPSFCSSDTFSEPRRHGRNHGQHVSGMLAPNSSCSSELADFSSGGDSMFSTRVSPFVGCLSVDSETSGNETTTARAGSATGRDDLPRTPFALGASMVEAPELPLASCFPTRHRRRHRRHSTGTGASASASTGSTSTGTGQAGSKTTGLTDSYPELNVNNLNIQGQAQGQGQGLENECTLADTWSFVERQLKRKMNFEDLLKRKSYAEHCQELHANFRSAVKGIRHFDSSSSADSSNYSYSGSGGSGSGSDAVSTGTHNTGHGNVVSSHTPIYDVGVDIMAKVLTYLHPMEVYSVLSSPLSKTFKSAFCNPQDLWKVLCLSEPFYAKVDKSRDGSDDSISSYPICKNLEVKHLLGRYRLLYSSFIKCVRYLDRIKEDAKNGRTPSATYENDHDDSSGNSFEDNRSLKSFFAKAHAVKRKKKNPSEDTSGSGSEGGSVSSQSSKISSLGDSRHDSKRRKSSETSKKKPKIKYSVSKLTNRLLGPVHSTGTAGNVGLPWSCAMYSVVNWMVAFADVAGIQLMCLKVLPELLVDEQQRTSAQHAGLTDIVLRAMVLFPHMVELHTAAFHTLVLLARPLGGKEGMLFRSAMVNASGIFNVGSSTGKSGIAIMLDSMKRFVNDEDLQAMSCWSMVNIALIPSQKVVLVRLGGISAAANAMIHHPHNAEVQFRALFALINLVIPSENLSVNSAEAQAISEQVAGMNQDTEIEMLDESIEQVTNLVVVAMKNFCSSEAILNRACLILHNLSLNETYHQVLLLTPNCYQMLEWCIGNYRHDNVLQQSARGTLQRLQLTLSSNPNLREDFTDSIRRQQKLAVESARRDAAMMLPEEPTDVLMNTN